MCLDLSLLKQASTKILVVSSPLCLDLSLLKQTSTLSIVYRMYCISFLGALAYLC
jgi:hypothetical protein